MRRVRTERERGYTVVELLTVVIIVGVLATLAVYGVRKYIYAAKSAEPIDIIGSIKAAEESYREETYTYLSVTSGLLTAEASHYPGSPDGTTKRMWGNTSHTDASRWNQLGLTITQPVQFGYAVKAGGAGTAMPTTYGTAYAWGSYAAGTTPWFVVQALGNLDGDTDYSVFVASNLNDTIHIQNEGE